MTAYWVLVFFSAAGLAASAPTDWRFTALFPNLLTFGAGVTAPRWLPRPYLKLFPPELPTAIEPLLMGMPLAFDRKAAGDGRAVIQFRVSGAEAGDYHVRVEGGRCRSFAGPAPAPDLVVHTPDTVWIRIARGELDGGRALQDGLYRVEGDLAVLAKMDEWFTPPRGAPETSQASARSFASGKASSDTTAGPIGPKVLIDLPRQNCGGLSLNCSRRSEMSWPIV